MEYELGAPGRAYTEWAAKMAVDLGTGVPWIMCKQDDAPDPIVSIASFNKSDNGLHVVCTCLIVTKYLLPSSIYKYI